MKTSICIAAALFQMLALAYMAGEREWVLLTGKTVHLRTAPIDPLDPFRGQYVRLDCEICRITSEFLRDGLGDHPQGERWEKDAVIYNALTVGEDGVARTLYATDRRPETDLFIRGRLVSGWQHGIRVRYGLDAYFVQQGRGLEIERGRDRNGIRVPLELEVAVGKNGLSVLRDHRWSPMGIGLDVEWQTATNPPENARRRRGRLPVAVNIRLLNCSDRDVAIVHRSDGQLLSLVPDSTPWQSNPWSWVEADTPRPPITDDDVRVMKPGELHRVRVDLTDPMWFVTQDGTPPSSISGSDSVGRFRLVYRPPSRSECRHLSQSAAIWHGTLESRAFSGRD